MSGKLATIAGLILIASTAAAADAASVGGHTYYVSSSSGDDTSPGVSPETPWKTLERVEAGDLGPGDRVLFRGGDTFPGTLRAFRCRRHRRCAGGVVLLRPGAGDDRRGRRERLRSREL